mgnify:CR=1 FL=1
MIDVVREKLPKEYERVVLEEYYKLFTNMYGTGPTLFRGPITYSLDESKLTKKDLADQILTSSIGAVKSVYEDDNLEFILYRENDNRISALARIRINENSDIHIAETLFLEYQDYDEKIRIISDIISELEEYARSLDCSILYYEIPKYDTESLDIAFYNGFKGIDESQRITSSQRTYLLSKPIALTRSNPDGCTLSRKQTPRTN